MSRERSTSRGRLKVGDSVMVISGGNKQKRPIKGKVGKIIRFVGDDSERAIVEGLNMFTKHQRALGPDKPAGKISREGSIHISNLMFYADKVSKPVRIKKQFLADGRKVRGYLDKSSKQVIQIDS